ncbi:ABC transporter substrate-binding protein [Ammoniphilus sp. CFH 90114]|nr:ABC transporter substrate-binding protein [Ammoniphilus sp. CFH 90114]
MVLPLMGCGNGEPSQADGAQNTLELPWEQVTEEAKGQKVNIYMWGGSDSINQYMDGWVAPRLKESTGVELNRVPIQDTKDILNQLLAEKQAGKTKGNTDIVWINGENFKSAKENGLLAGSFAAKLPNVQQFVNHDAPDIRFDFGLDTEGMEAPWGKAQFVFVYDSAKIPNPPKSMNELKEWVKANPGKFTYPAPPDFTGSAFIRHVLVEVTGDYQPFIRPFQESELAPLLPPMWDYLQEIEPYLWREGKTYPESLGKLDQLYANGEVWMTMGYDPARASNEMANGTFGPSTRTFVLDGGTLANTHYLSIPFNAANKAGAMIAINYLLSPEAQMAKLDPSHWGEGMVLDLEKLSPEDRERVEQIDRGLATLSTEELEKHQLPEFPAEYVDYLEKGWIENVAKK